MMNCNYKPQCTAVTVNNFPTHLTVNSLSVNGNININGNVQFPTGLEFSSVITNPGTTPQNTLWVSSNINNIYYGNSTIQFQPISSIGSDSNIIVNNITPSSFNVSLNSDITISTISISTLATTNRIISNSLEPYPLCIYVSQSGSDITGTGSQSNPYSTIQKGITFAETLTTALDPVNIPTIYINEGFYQESLVITKSINMVGSPFLLNNLTNFTGPYSRIGNTSTIITISSSQPNHTITCQYLDFRCPISNSETTPIYPVRLNMLYSNFNINTARPIINLSGVSNTERTILFASNVRSNGGGQLMPVYLFSSFTDIYLEECRWNGASAKSMIQANGTLNVNRCELVMLSAFSSFTNVPLILQETTAGDTGFININDSNLRINYGTLKTPGSNIITISPSTSIPNGQIILNNCNTNISNTIASTFIVQNQSSVPYTLQLNRQTSMMPNNNSIFSTSNLSFINSNIITPISRYAYNIDLNLNNLLNCSTITSPSTITFRKSTTGNIIFNNLPTSPPLESGALWISSNVIKIV